MVQIYVESNSFGLILETLLYALIQTIHYKITLQLKKNLYIQLITLTIL